MDFNYPTTDEIIIRLKKLIKKIENFQKITECFEIPNHQARILFPIIKDEKGYSIQELSKLVGVDKAFVSRTITNLENNGIVERDKKADSNEKNYKIILSEKGKLLLEQRLIKIKKIMDKWLENVTKEEVMTFNKLLNEFTKE